MKGERSGNRRQRAQSLVELSLILPAFLLLLAGAADFGYLYSERLEVSNATRVGVRWASTHPSAWSNSAVPADTTIEGEIIYAGDTRTVVNDDNHVQIKYYDMGTSPQTYCGAYSINPALNAGLGGFVAAAGYTQATCVKAGNLITVTVNYDYQPFMPIFRQAFGNVISVGSTAAMIEQI